MDYQAIAENLVGKCNRKGADAAEAYIETSRGLSIELRNGELETVEEAASYGLGLRVFVNGRMAFSHCNDFSPAALDNAVDSAVTLAGKTSPNEHNVLPEDQAAPSRDDLYDPAIAKIPLDQKIDAARQVETIALADDRISKSDGASYGENENEIFIANSHGLSRRLKTANCWLGVSVVAEQGEEKSASYEYCSRRFYSDLKTPQEIGEKAAREAAELLGARRVRTQTAPVIFHPDVARTLLAGILRPINGERVLQGASFLADKLDQKIGCEHLTVIDDPTLPRGLRSRPFDGEGVPTQKRTIVDKGVLKGFMYHSASAHRAGVASTGNARRGGYTSLPRIGSYSFYLTAGEHTPEDIIAATPRGLLLKSVTGYGINSVNGNFSGGAKGFWIEDGKVAFPVKGLTIASTADEMFNGIDMVANDLDLNRTTIAPTFRIRSMQIGGD